MKFSYNNTIVQNDLVNMAEMLTLKESLNRKTVLVTGATGMLATYITYFLCYLNKMCDIEVNVIALCRTKAKADSLFSEFYSESWFNLILQDICDPLVFDGNIDYVFHLAGNASPYYIKNDPVGILKSNLLGTFNLLEFVKNKKIKKFLFASTREVYGKNESVEFLTETSFGSFDCLDARSCYPESKRAAETVCKSYSIQYGVPFNSVRIAHSYGPGMNLRNDGRVMADLMSNAVNGENIILKSDGSAERAFCYITDAVIGMFLVLLKGDSGKAYNIANETEPISIRDLALYLSTLGGVEVVFDIPQEQSNVYCNYKRSGLNTDALKNLGWKASVSLREGVRLTFNSFV